MSSCCLMSPHDDENLVQFHLLNHLVKLHFFQWKRNEWNMKLKVPHKGTIAVKWEKSVFLGAHSIMCHSTNTHTCTMFIHENNIASQSTWRCTKAIVIHSPQGIWFLFSLPSGAVSFLRFPSSLLPSMYTLESPTSAFLVLGKNCIPFQFFLKVFSWNVLWMFRVRSLSCCMFQFWSWFHAQDFWIILAFIWSWGLALFYNSFFLMR